MSLALNQTLTTFARGLTQDLLAGSVAEFFAPSVQVPGAIGKYKSFGDADAFQIYNTERAPGADPERIIVSASDTDYNCKPHALETTIDISEREQYGDGDPLGLEQMKIRSLLISTGLAYEKRVIAKAKTLSAVSGVGVWAAGANNPIAEIDAQIAAIATVSGQMPNRLAIGLPAWTIIRNHPEVIKRFPGAALVGVSVGQFASLLLNPSIEIKVGVLSSNANKPGATVSKANMVGSDLFVFLASPAATKDDPSFMKAFKTRTGGIDAVKTYTAPNGLYDGIITMWSEDIQVTGSVCGRRITVS